MGAKAILDLAYDAGVVPHHLHGKTQEKTLQARISEDILHHRANSVFFRTEPGQFFLTEFLKDESIPSEWKIPFPARRRTRDLTRDYTLAIDQAFLSEFSERSMDVGEFLAAADAANAVAYMHPNEMPGRGFCAVWTFSIVVKNDCALAYRVGRYRDDRDAYAQRRSIGFPGPLTVNDSSLFARDSIGAEECAISVLSQDLDLSYVSFEGDDDARPVTNYLTVIGDNETVDVVIVITWPCPDWFEPTTRRLSLNDPHWLSLTVKHNDLDDFEPWSARILELGSMLEVQSVGGNEADHRQPSGIHCVRIRK
jgi:hypothetical protein